MNAELAGLVEFNATQWQKRLRDEPGGAVTTDELRNVLELIISLAAAVRESASQSQ